MGSPPGTPVTIAQVLGEAVARFRDREALVSGAERLTYQELGDSVLATVTRLAVAGIGAGDRVIGCMSNTVDMVVAFLAVTSLGGIWVGVSPHSAAGERRFIVENCEPSITLVEAGGSHLVRDTPALEAPEWRVTSTGAPVGTFAQLASRVVPTSPAGIAYTSGTTGQPKGVVHSHHNLLLPGCYRAASGDTSEATRQGLALPLSILNMMVLGPLSAIQAGASCVLFHRLHAPELSEWVEREAVTAVSLPPPVVHDLVADDGIPAERLRTLAKPQIGGAGCPDVLCARFEEKFGQRPARTYGLTELPTVVAVEDRDVPRVANASGRVVAYLSVTIGGLPGGNDGSSDRGDEIGEILVGSASTGPWADTWTPMLGYWREPEATARTLAGGLLHTGDIGRLDSLGNLIVTGRANTVIIRGGANVYPLEVECVLAEDERIASSAVLGLPDDRLGERVVAVVETGDAEPVTPESIRERCTEHLSAYKIPEVVVVVRALPRNAMGKIDRKTLAAMLPELMSGTPARERAG